MAPGWSGWFPVDLVGSFVLGSPLCFSCLFLFLVVSRLVGSRNRNAGDKPMSALGCLSGCSRALWFPVPYRRSRRALWFPVPYRRSCGVTRLVPGTWRACAFGSGYMASVADMTSVTRLMAAWRGCLPFARSRPRRSRLLSGANPEPRVTLKRVVCREWAICTANACKTFLDWGFRSA